MAANEASAVGSVRTMNTAAITFSSTYGDGFPPNIASIGTTGTVVSCQNAGLIDSVLTTGQKSGYNFALVAGTVVVLAANVPAGCTAGYTDGYVVTATPVTVGTTGQRAFCSDATAVIRFDPIGTATTASPFCAAAMTPLQ